MIITRIRLQDDPTRRWLVARTHVHGEDWALRHLHNQGFTPYLPRYFRNYTVNKRPTRRVLVPLFPRYIFVLYNKRWRSIYATYGIRSILMDGDKPGLVKDQLIRLFKAHERDGVYQVDDAPKPGEQLRVTNDNHVMHGQIGIHAGMTDGDRVKVLFSIMGKSVKAVLNTNDVEAA